MFAAERQKEIRTILQNYKKINVSSLAQLLHVTEVTIRKDLEQLEQEGFLLRQHGGAILREEVPTTAAQPAERSSTLPFAPINAKCKQDIAQVCVQYIQNEDIVFLGGDDISCFVAQLMQKADHLLHVIVVTNSLYVSLQLAQLPYVTLLSPGGQLYQLNGNYAYYGSSTITALQHYYFTKAFINVDAVSFEQGYMVSLQETAQLYEHILPRSDEVILTFESSKFHKRSLHHLLQLSEGKTVISNQNIPEEYKQYCYEHGVKLFTALQDVLARPEP